jgi:hypothetical protein
VRGADRRSQRLGPRAPLGCSGFAIARWCTPQRLAQPWPLGRLVWECWCSGVCGGSHLVGMVDRFSLGVEGFAMASAVGVTPVGHEFSALLQHDSGVLPQFDCVLVVVPGWAGVHREQSGCHWEREGVFVLVMDTALDTVSAERCVKCGLGLWVSSPLS